jgi:hypothetical protein
LNSINTITVVVHHRYWTIHSFKDFLFHLLTVEIGILIALSLKPGVAPTGGTLLLEMTPDRAKSTFEQGFKSSEKG